MRGGVLVRALPSEACRLAGLQACRQERPAHVLCLHACTPASPGSRRAGVQAEDMGGLSCVWTRRVSLADRRASRCDMRARVRVGDGGM